MKKYTFIILILLSVLGSSSLMPASADSEFRVGALLSLSGDCADVGDMARRGIQLAIEQINASGGILGKPVKMLLEDSAESSSANAVTAFKRLLLNSDIQYFIGPSCSPAGLAVAPLAAKNSAIVLASPSIGLKEFNQAGDNIFKLWPYDEDGPKLLARYAIKKGWKKAAIFSSQQAWEQAQGNWIEQEFKRLGGTILEKVEPLPSNNTLRAEALKLAATKPEVIFLSNYINFDVAAKELRKTGYKGPKLSTLMTEEKIKLAQGALAGTIAYGYPPATDQFLKLYSAKYGASPLSIGADTAYDIMHLYAKVINETGNQDPLIIRKRLCETKDYPGASGRLSIDHKGGVLRQPLLFVVQGKKLVPVRESDAER